MSHLTVFRHRQRVHTGPAAGALSAAYDYITGFSAFEFQSQTRAITARDLLFKLNTGAVTSSIRAVGLVGLRRNVMGWQWERCSCPSLLTCPRQHRSAVNTVR